MNYYQNLKQSLPILNLTEIKEVSQPDNPYVYRVFLKSQVQLNWLFMLNQTVQLLKILRVQNTQWAQMIANGVVQLLKS